MLIRISASLRAALFVVVMLASSGLSAGEFLVGLRTWEASWSPGVMRQIEKTSSFLNLVHAVNGDQAAELVPFTPDGASGFYAGPMLSYVTDDHRWSFSLVGLTGHSSSQGVTSVHIAQSTDQGIFMDNRTVSSSASPVRHDLDFTAGYALNDHWKAFAGLKYQSYEYDMHPRVSGTRDGVATLGGETVSGYMVGTGNVEAWHRYGGPAGGLAYSWAIHDTGSLTLSIGGFVGSGTSTESSMLFSAGRVMGATTRLNVWQIIGSEYSTSLRIRAATAELTYTTPLSDNVLLQFGFRTQASRLDILSSYGLLSYQADGNGLSANLRNPPDAHIFDRFQGFTLSAIYRL